MPSGPSPVKAAALATERSSARGNPVGEPEVDFAEHAGEARKSGRKHEKKIARMDEPCLYVNALVELRTVAWRTFG